MKYIGTSLGRCLRSILKGEVSINDIFLIVAGTHANSMDKYLLVVEGYYYERRDSEYNISEWPINDVLEVAEQLWYYGKIHQPRNFGAQPFFLSIDPLWIEVFPPHLLQKPATKDLWEKLRIVARLSE